MLTCLMDQNFLGASTEAACRMSGSLCPGNDNGVCVCKLQKCLGYVMCEVMRKVMQEIKDIIALVDVNVCSKGTAGSSEECRTTLAQLASFYVTAPSIKRAFIQASPKTESATL